MVRLLTSPKVRFGALTVLVIALFVTFVLVGGPSRDDIEAFIESAGPVAPIAFVLLYLVASILVFPGAVLTAAAGIVFGTWWGTLLSIIGATLGAAAAFELGRWLGRDLVERIAGERISQFDDWLERRGFTAVLYTRLVPIFPFNLLNYAAGVSGVQRRDYLVATAVGIIPGTFAYAALGGNLDDPTSPEFIAAVVLVVVLAVGGPIVNRALRRRGYGVPETEPDDPEPESDKSEATTR
ncbi:MAG: TVP38/TMEM64 family protein [Nitriliruptorales bacterium]|nr:TVP38/TMEM64 family protein [Nitriliruptorales bacterium]